MTISNFQRTGQNQGHEFASIDVTTGFLWWSKTERKEIAKTSINWFFIEDGKLCPMWGCEELSMAYDAKEALKSKC